MSDHGVHQEKIRYHGLDHLRGILALLVLVYHLITWEEIALNPVLEGPLNLIGLYAVSTFYIISGAALFCVYWGRPVNPLFLKSFFLKRALRIVPLFWFVLLISLGFDDFRKFETEPYRVFLNFSLLFSWFAPSEYFAVGSWSIGNEWAFYCLFPAMLMLARSAKGVGTIFILSVLISCTFSMLYLDDQHESKLNWESFVHPFNQLIFFSGGFVVGFLLRKATFEDGGVTKIKGKKVPIGFIGPAGGVVFLITAEFLSQVESATALWKLFLTLVCMICCFSAGCRRQSLGGAGKILSWLGSISYSLYLLHPIVYRVASVGFQRTGEKYLGISSGSLEMKATITASTLLGTFVAATLSYHFLESPAIKLGKKFANQLGRQKSES